MHVVHARVGSAVEWVVAAAFLIATLGVGSLVLRELRAAATAVPELSVPAAAPGFSALPAGLADKAVSVPLLILTEEKEIRVGDTQARVASVLGREAETGVQQTDLVSSGERTTRFYDFSGTRFALVFESSARDGVSRVSAIYLQ